MLRVEERLDPGPASKLLFRWGSVQVQRTDETTLPQVAYSRRGSSVLHSTRRALLDRGAASEGHAGWAKYTGFENLALLGASFDTLSSGGSSGAGCELVA